MNHILELITEIHRRSLWQVLGIYALGSWGALQFVDFASDNFGLPDWVAPFALVLLVIGLPIVLATAFVQEGRPGGAGKEGGGLSRAAADSASALAGEPHPFEPGLVEPTNLAAGTGSLDVRRRRPSFLRRHLTWRRAILGGIGAFSLLGMGVAAYFTSWALGIGPVGSLVAQGVLEEQDRVVLADFGNATGDSLLGGVVTEALRVDLLQSSVIRVMEPGEVRGVLQRMQRDASVRLTEDLAREVAIREGAKAVIRGEVGSAGSGYVLTASIVAARDGGTLAAFRETARDEDGLVSAIDKLSQRIREKAGESLRSIQGSEPLSTVTTSSLEALRLYMQAEDLEQGGDAARSIALLRQAVQIDTAFAMAWRKLGVVISNRGGDQAAMIEALTHAYRHRDRLTERERHLATATYHWHVTQDESEVEHAYRAVLEVDPDDGVALNNLALLLNQRGDHEDAVELLERAVEGPGRSASAFSNLAFGLYVLARTEEAYDVLDRFAAAYPGHPNAEGLRFNFAAGRGEWGEVERIVEEGLSHRDDPALRFQIRTDGVAGLAVLRGQLARARAELAEVAEMREISPEQRFRLGVFPAAIELLVRRRPDDSRRALAAVLEGWGDVPPVARPYPMIAAGLAMSGDPDAAEALLEEGVREQPEAIREANDENWRFARAAIAAERGQPAELVEAGRFLRRELPGCGRCGWLEMADGFRQMGQADSAAVHYARWVETPWPDFNLFVAIELPRALERGARAFEEAGDTAKAVEYYERFAELWAGADAELQPRVRDARERARILSAAMADAGAPEK